MGAEIAAVAAAIADHFRLYNEEFGRITFVQRQAAGVAGVEILQSKVLAFGDSEWMNELSYTITSFIFRHPSSLLSRRKLHPFQTHDHSWPLLRSTPRRWLSSQAFRVDGLAGTRINQTAPKSAPALPAATNPAKRTTSRNRRQSC